MRERHRIERVAAQRDGRGAAVHRRRVGEVAASAVGPVLESVLQRIGVDRKIRTRCRLHCERQHQPEAAADDCAFHVASPLIEGVIEGVRRGCAPDLPPLSQRFGTICGNVDNFDV